MTPKPKAKKKGGRTTPKRPKVCGETRSAGVGKVPYVCMRHYDHDDGKGHAESLHCSPNDDEGKFIAWWHSKRTGVTLRATPR